MRQLMLMARMVVRHHSTPKHALRTFTPLRTSNRFSSGYVGYRELNYDPDRPFQKVLAEVLTGIMYWWIGWNLMTDWRHLIGEFIWPQRSEWTDEELGIPSE